jgi:hypothetical protein
VAQFAWNELVDLWRAEECVRFVGHYIRTAKNSLVVDHHAKLGFSAIVSDGRETFGELRVEQRVSRLKHLIERDEYIA